MGSNKYFDAAQDILKYIGGPENVGSAAHCATRLRFELKNEAKADKEALESLPYVMKVIASGGQYQVVIGPDVNNYYNAILSIANIGNKKDNKYDEKQFVSPLDENCEKKFTYFANGEIIGDDYTIGLLNLNAYELKNARKSVIRALQGLSKDIIKECYMNEENEIYEPYYNVIKWFWKTM